MYTTNFIKGLTTAILLRKSRKDIEEEERAKLRGEEYDTLERHRKELLRFARKYNLKILDIFQEVISGASELENREQMNELLENVKLGKYECVLCIHLDRLTRGDNSEEIHKIFKKSGTLVVTPDKIYDLNTEEGETSADVDSFIAKMEYRRIKKRLEDGKHRAIFENKSISSRVPYAYTRDIQTKKLTINEEEAANVKLMYQLVIEGYGLTAIARKLYNMGIKTKLGNDFSSKTVGDIIKNVVYKGDNFYGKTKNRRKNNNFTYVKNTHTPVVDEETWNIANKMLERKSVPVNIDKKITNPFASLLCCGNCNKKMKSNYSRGKRRVYCGTFGCDTVSTLLSNIEVKFLEGMHQIINDVSIKLEPKENNSLDLLNSKLDKVDRNIQEVNSMIEEAYILLERKVYTPEIFLERSKTNNNKLEELKSTRENILKQIDEEMQRLEKVKNIKPKIISMLEIYHKSNSEQKNKILRSFITKIVYNRKKENSLLLDFSLDIYFD